MSREVLARLFGPAASAVHDAREPVVAHGPVARLLPLLGGALVAGPRELKTFAAGFSSRILRPHDRGDGMMVYRELTDDEREHLSLSAKDWLMFDAVDGHYDAVLAMRQRLQRTLAAHRAEGRCRAFAHGPAAHVPRHCDDSEVIVIHIFGRRSWRLEPNDDPPVGLEDPVPIVASGHSRWDRAFGSRGRTIALRAGSVLYVPHGWWHETRSAHASFSLSVVFPRR